MVQPQGFVDEHNLHLFCRLHKALYSMKQAHRTWFDKLHEALLMLGCVLVKSHHSLFIKTTSDHIIYILIYVDDILVTESDSRVIS